VAVGQTAAFGPCPVVWEVAASATPAPFAAHIPTGLAPARRPRSEPLAAFSRAKEAKDAGKEEAVAAATAAGSTAVAKPEDEDKPALPGADLPPVIAPSR